MHTLCYFIAVTAPFN